MEVVNNIASQSMLKYSLVIPTLIVLGVIVYRKRQKETLQCPRKWKEVGKVKNLIIYPLKSGCRVNTERAVCTDVGLQMPECGTMYQLRDRDFVIYKEGSYNFENNPKIRLIKLLASDSNHVVLEAPGMETLKLVPPSSTTNQSGILKLLNNEKVHFLDCGDEASTWVSNYLLGEESGLRLGFNNNSHRRNLQEAYGKYLKVYPTMKDHVAGLYSNISSYMLLTQASVDDINNKVADQTISVHNFRPNIVIDGDEPFAEDNWEWVKIGDVILYRVKYCTRCPSVTIDAETSKRNDNYEPLRTMRTYRQLKDLKNIDLDGDKCVMGVNMALEQGGEIHIGDAVFVGEN